MLTDQNKPLFTILINQNKVLRIKIKQSLENFPWTCVLETTVKFNIFSNIQLINKKSDSNIDGHMKEQS